MTVKRKAAIGAIAALFVALAVGWYFASPHWTLRQMQAAAEARDGERLASYMDFEALRSNMKAAARVKVLRDIESGTTSAASLPMLMSMIDPMVDATWSRENLVATAADAKAQGGIAGAEAIFGKAEIQRTGLNEFLLHHPDNTEGAGDVVFERRGLGWKMTKMIIPLEKP